VILIGTSLDLDADGPLLAEQPARFDKTRSVIRLTPPPLTVAAGWLVGTPGASGRMRVRAIIRWA
jgi:hypothetical protein